MCPELAPLTDLTAARVRELVLSLGEPGYRAKQLLRWVYRRLASSFEEMTDLPPAFRQRLAGNTRLHSLAARHEVAGPDGTIKTLFTLADGRSIETVLMPYPGDGGRVRYTVCASTQVGCAVGCPFCATGQQGFERHLTPGEIIDQVLYFARCLRGGKAPAGQAAGQVSNVVFMGMGEPLANYAALWQAIETLNSPEAFGLGARNMVISTAGFVPGIERLSREKLQVGLAVSLHAADNALRDRLVPLNRKYPLEMLLPACRRYVEANKRRLTIEYVLFGGINDSLPRARSLAGLLRGMGGHVNLIPANDTADPVFRPPLRPAVLAFASELRRLHINCTVRQPRGLEISAGCGQLRSRYLAGEAGPEDNDRLYSGGK